MGFFESIMSTETMYLLSILLVNVCYIALFLGIIASVPYYVLMIQLGVQIFLCLVLLIRFHPFQDNYKITRFDATLIFGAVVIILTNVIFVELLNNEILGPYISRIKTFAKNNAERIIHE
jgi:hypothetical protein